MSASPEMKWAVPRKDGGAAGEVGEKPAAARESSGFPAAAPIVVHWAAAHGFFSALPRAMLDFLIHHIL
jgi:hypothetical protein